jgi:hypothetical protein
VSCTRRASSLIEPLGSASLQGWAMLGQARMWHAFSQELCVSELHTASCIRMCISKGTYKRSVYARGVRVCVNATICDAPHKASSATARSFRLHCTTIYHGGWIHTIPSVEISAKEQIRKVVAKKDIVQRECNKHLTIHISRTSIMMHQRDFECPIIVAVTTIDIRRFRRSLHTATARSILLEVPIRPATAIK